jgi:8-oxoguanine deaminase
MTTLLVNNIHTLITMDSVRREIPNGALFIRDRIIEQVGTTAELPHTADEALEDATSSCLDLSTLTITP